jgi:hypothetical protein
VRDGLEVSAGERLGLDIEMQIGQFNETVSVTVEAPMLEATSDTAGQVIGSGQVENMPLNGRTPLSLAQLAMGVVPNSDPNCASTTAAPPDDVHTFNAATVTNVRLNFSRFRAPLTFGNVRQDGADNVDLSMGTAITERVKLQFRF